MTDEILKKLSEISENQQKMIVVQESQEKLLEKHTETLEKQGEVLLRNTITVEEHHRRSLALEAQMEQLEKEVRHIENHVSQMEGVGNFFKVVGWVVGAILGIGGVLSLIARGIGVF